MYCLQEMGYTIKSMEFYSMQDNKKYRVFMPSEKEKEDFFSMIERYRKFDMLQENWRQNTSKCRKCIYRELCDYFVGEIYPQLALFEETSIKKEREEK